MQLVFAVWVVPHFLRRGHRRGPFEGSAEVCAGEEEGVVEAESIRPCVK